MTDRNHKSNKFLFLYLGLILLLAVFLAGYGYGISRGEDNANVVSQAVDSLTDKLDNQPGISLFNQVWQTIQNDYIYGPIDQKEALYGITGGLVDSLDDRNSVFLDPEMADIFNEEMSGNFEGVGIEIGIKNDQLVVITPLAGTPAARAGIKSGDQIKGIDGFDTTGISLDYAVSLIRGEKGTEVVLTIERDEEEQDIAVTRDTISVQSVEWETKTTEEGHKLGFIEINQFRDDTENLFNQAINDLLLDSLQGIILDLRNNPGGYLNVAVDLASEFVEDGVILIERDAQGNKIEFTDDSRQPKLGDLPAVVLVNQGSASASEILAGALADNGIAELVGTTTFGKGTVQDLQEFSDGSLLKLSVAEWLTPNGLSIEEQGIEPDYLVELTDEDYNNDRDPQLARALELIDEKI